MGSSLRKKSPTTASLITMGERVVLDITSFTKTTNKDKVLKILKAAGMAVCKITDPYHNEFRNKNTISITVKRADYEAKTPDYPGSWIIEEDYAQDAPEVGPLL